MKIAEDSDQILKPFLFSISYDQESTRILDKFLIWFPIGFWSDSEVIFLFRILSRNPS
jgi:hypothetical protein